MTDQHSPACKQYAGVTTHFTTSAAEITPGQPSDESESDESESEENSVQCIFRYHVYP